MDSFIGELRLMAFPFAPKGWLYCQGQELSADTYRDLYRLLGNTYGGQGPATFRLPDLRGRAALAAGQGPESDYRLGEPGGSAGVTLTAAQLPAHSHPYTASLQVGGPARESHPSGGYPSGAPNSQYATAAPAGTRVPMAADAAQYALESAGGQPHENRQPFLVLNYAIALVGEYPSRG